MRNLRQTLWIAGACLSLAGLMGAYSYSTATVNSTGHISIVDTSSALLALSPDNNGGMDMDKTVTSKNGSLLFDFNKGYGGADFGIQPNANYVWNNLFDVTNNSNNPVKVTVFASGGAPAGLYVESDKATGAEKGWIPMGAMSFDLAPGATSRLSVMWDTTANPSYAADYLGNTYNADFQVTAQPVTTP